MSSVEGGCLPGARLSAGSSLPPALSHEAAQRCCPACDLGVQLPAATALSALAPGGASPGRRPGKHLAGIISPCTDWTASLGAAACRVSPRLFTANPAASSALPGVTGTAGAHAGGRAYRTRPLERRGCAWGERCGPCAVAAGRRSCVPAGCCRQRSMRLVYAGRRGLGLCVEMLWQGAPA